MIGIISAAIFIFIISLVFSMFGKGGGELYLPVIISLLNIAFYTAAGISLFLIFLQSISMTFIYSHKHNLVDWKIAFLLAVIVGVFSFMGGFLSKDISAFYLKLTFSIFLLISAILLLLNKGVKINLGRFGVWHRKFKGGEYDVHIIYLLISVASVAFLAGMLGISGGGLIVPIAVIVGGMPLRIAMGTNTFLVLASSSMGFMGHVARGSINWMLCGIFSISIITGSQIGSHLHMRVRERHLRIGLASILIFAALWMMVRMII